MTDLPDLLAKRAGLTPDAMALEEHATGQKLTFAQFNSRADAAARLLLEAGVRPGDRVGVLCRNRIAFFETLFAAAKTGAVLVPFNWRMPAAELKGILAHATPKLVFVGAEDRAALEGTGFEGGIVDFDDPTTQGYEARCQAAPALPLRAFWPDDETWYLLYTSGTTGDPKAVIQTYRMAMANYVNVRQAIDFQSSDRTLNFLPLFHTAGINLYTLPFLFAGATTLILPGFDPDLVMGILKRGEVSHFFGVPAVYQALSLHPDFESMDFSGVASWGCGGAALPDVMISAFLQRGARVCNGYGMTETGPTCYLMDPNFVADKIGSVGRVQLLTEKRIVAPDNTPVAHGEVGELQLKGPAITPGYWNAPERTAEVMTDDGWLRTGDLVREDADGFAYITGRSKEMFISGGENVYPAEVEKAYDKHPAVLETAVIGVPDEKWGEVGCAFILLRPESSATPEELTRYGREMLAPFKVPKSFVFVEDFKRTAAGKVQKHYLTKP